MTKTNAMKFHSVRSSSVPDIAVAAMKMDKRRVLLVSQQSPMTLRQSYYDNGKLKLSRLALHRMAREDSLSDVRYVQNDVRNTLLYLRSQRLLRRNESLEVCVVVHDDLYESFTAAMSDDELITFTVLRQSEISKKIGVKRELPTPFADGLFAHILLAKSRIENHYGPRDLTRFFRYHKVRKGLWLVAGLVLLIGATYTANRYYEVQLLRKYTTETRIHRKLYRKHYYERVGQSEAYKLQPDAVKSTVNTVNQLREYAEVTPLPFITRVAETVTRNPNITVSRINWLRYPQPDVQIGNNTVRSRGSIRPDIDIVDHHYQIISVEGRVVDYGDDFRFAVEVFEDFLRDIRSSADLESIDVQKTPFNIDSDTGLAGDSGTSARENLVARSTFKLHATVKQPVAPEDAQ